MSKVKVGVIGVGALGRHHARLYAQNEAAEVVGIFDVNAAAAEKVGAEFGLPVFADFRALAEKCDALSVATPATFHGDTVLPLLEMGKHVLVEKPIAATLEEAEKMVAAAEAKHLVLGVGQVERFNPSLAVLKEFPGRIVGIEAHRLAPYPPARPGLPPRGTEVSVTLDLMIHDIDLVLSLIDRPITSIDAVGAPVLSPSNDVVSVRLRFADGSFANLTASRIAAEPRRIFRIYQPERYLSLNLNTHSAVVASRENGALSRNEVILPERNALADELADFVAAVQTGGVCRCPGKSGLAALRVAGEIEKLLKR